MKLVLAASILASSVAVSRSANPSNGNLRAARHEGNNQGHQEVDGRALPEGLCPIGWTYTGTDDSGHTCTKSWANNCQENCANQSCTEHGGNWIPFLDHSSHPYTCKFKDTGSTSVQWYSSTTNPAFNHEGGVTWKEVKAFCNDQGKRLCDYDEICPYAMKGVPSGNPVLGSGSNAQRVDQWIPVVTVPGDPCHENAWVQIGKWGGGSDHTCGLHEALGGCPSWGETKAGTMAFQQFAACCPPREGEFCWRTATTRGGISFPKTCPSDHVNLGLACFDDDKECPDGYHKFGAGCHQTCPEGFKDSGLACLVDGPLFTAQTPYFWLIGDPLLSASGQFARCEVDHGPGKCFYDGSLALVYPNCPRFYYYDRLGVCLRQDPNCSSVGMLPGIKGYFNCFRKIISAFNKKTCTNDQGEQSLGLCYLEPCPEGYEGAGPTCWSPPPAGWVSCGMGAAKTSSTYAAITYQQVDSVVSLAMNIASLALWIASAGATSGTEFARLIKMLRDFVKVYQNFNQLLDKTMAKFNKESEGVTGWLDLFKEDTSEVERLRIVAQICSMFDPTGIASIVAAYSFDQCQYLDSF